jgi:hypothetical protein
MRLLFITNVIANPYQLTKGTFNLSLVRALAKTHEVRVIVPVSWADEWKIGRKSEAYAMADCEALPRYMEALEGVPTV